MTAIASEHFPRALYDLLDDAPGKVVRVAWDTTKTWQKRYQ
jgi:hypothetical protein